MSTLGDASVNTANEFLGPDNEFWFYIGQYVGTGGPPTSVTARMAESGSPTNVKTMVATSASINVGPGTANSATAGAIIAVSGTEAEFTVALTGTSSIATNDHVWVGILAEAEVQIWNDGSDSGTSRVRWVNFASGYASGFNGGLPPANFNENQSIRSIEIEIDDTAAGGSLLLATTNNGGF